MEHWDDDGDKNDPDSYAYDDYGYRSSTLCSPVRTAQNCSDLSIHWILSALFNSDQDLIRSEQILSRNHNTSYQE